MQKVFAAVAFVVSLCTFVYGQPTDPLSGFRALGTHGNPSSDAFKALIKQFNDQTNLQIKAKMALFLGIASYTNGQKDLAAQYLSQSLELKTKLDDYAQFYLGLVERDNKDWNGARKHFEFVKNHVPKSVKASEAETELARIAKTQENWREAYNRLISLERRTRREVEYPNILFDLVETGYALKKNAEVCRDALRLYSRYAAYSLSLGWKSDISLVKVKDLQCHPTIQDKERRVKNLILAGEFDEVREELKNWSGQIQSLKGSSEESEKVDELLGQLDLAEGKIKEAVAHFQDALNKVNHNFSIQMLLAHAYSQTDDYGRAVEGYLEAYRLSPKSKKGLKALFQAAFLSYQNRDYDGASRHFEDLAQKSKGRLAWDAKWHLAWIRYLKADYDGALKAFIELTKDKHFAKSVDLEKLTYWQAMSEFRLGHIEDARPLFTSLAANKRLGYYTGAATARLFSLPASTVPVPTPPPAPVRPIPSGLKLTGATPSNLNTTVSPLNGVKPAPSPGDPQVVNGSNRKPSSIEGASEESLGGQVEGSDKLEEEKGEDEEQTPEAFAEAPPITSLKNPALLDRFERVKDLLDLGFQNWGRSELREIEKRTSNRGYLQTLMGEYEKAGDYFRTAYIGDVIFEQQREKGGVDGERALWMYAFPEAFAKQVFATCKKFEISPFLAWSIIRGESGFREDIHSSAGALGLMQLIPPTAKKVALDLKYKDFSNSMMLDPDINILFGVRYLKRLSKTMKDNIPLVVASYNAGPHRVLGWLKDFGNLDLDEFIEHIPYMETRNYVKKVTRNLLVYETLYEKRTNILSWLPRKPTFKFDGPKPLAESWTE